MMPGLPPDKDKDKDKGTPDKDKDTSEKMALLTSAIRSNPNVGGLRAQYEKMAKGADAPKREKVILRAAASKARPLPVPEPVVETTETVARVRTIEPGVTIVSTIEPPLPTTSATRIEAVPTGSEPKLPTWKQQKLDEQRRGLERQERAAKLTTELMLELDELDTIDASACQLFRADGRSPWQMLEKHHGQFLPQPGAMSLIDFYTEVFVTSVSPEDWFGKWIASHPKGKPCVSTGPKFEDSQGASNTNWFYGFSIPGGLIRVGPSAAVLQVELGLPAAKACAQTGVYLLTDTGHIGDATIIAMRYGPIGEYVWLTGVPAECVVAYAKSTATPWLARWRPFKPAQINKYGKLLSSTKYADLVNWKQLYDPGK
ncbi:MAG TPA: hypothetical protein VH352_08880 [Pseudonocardiaceae bacterium]|jgi:hypothetical protein|nr:hypothetical protein [Pseudonocardiaceae bacterium]